MLGVRVDSFIDTRSVKESVIPFSDGTNVHVPAVTEILVNIHCLNTDEGIWGSDARVWRPERWQGPLPQGATKIPGIWGNVSVPPLSLPVQDETYARPTTRLSFGGGPKSCM